MIILMKCILFKLVEKFIKTSYYGKLMKNRLSTQNNYENVYSAITVAHHSISFWSGPSSLPGWRPHLLAHPLGLGYGELSRHSRPNSTTNPWPHRLCHDLSFRSQNQPCHMETEIAWVFKGFWELTEFDFQQYSNLNVSNVSAQDIAAFHCRGSDHQCNSYML